MGLTRELKLQMGKEQNKQLGCYQNGVDHVHQLVVLEDLLFRHRLSAGGIVVRLV